MFRKQSRDFILFQQRLDSYEDVDIGFISYNINDLQLPGNVILQLFHNESQMNYEKFLLLAESIPNIEGKLIKDLIINIKKEAECIKKGNYVYLSTWMFKLISLLFQENVLTIDDIKELMKMIEPASREAIFLFCTNLIPYIKDETLLNEMKNEIKEGPYKNENFARIAFTLDLFEDNDWLGIKQFVDNFEYRESLSYAIINDNEDTLSNVCSSSQFNINQQMERTGFEIKYLTTMPTPICGAAFYSSIKCFKFLILNKAKITPLMSIKTNDDDWYDFGNNIARCAVAGGNLEIIRILNQMNVSFTDCIRDAALYHRNEVFQWIVNFNCPSDKELSKSFFDVVSSSIRTFNYSIMDLIFENYYEYVINMIPKLLYLSVDESNYLLINLLIDVFNKKNETKKNETRDIVMIKERNSEHLLSKAVSNSDIEMIKYLLNFDFIDINEKDSIGETSLHKCAIKNNIESIRFLLSFSEIDVNPTSNSKATPLHHAARLGNAEIVKILLDRPEIKPDEEDKYSFTPFLYAVASGSIETVKLFITRKDIRFNHESKELENAKSLASTLPNKEEMICLLPSINA